MSYIKRIDPDTKVKLKKFEPSDHSGLSEAEATGIAQELGKELSHLQDLLFAASRHSLLIVLQGIDTSGKDGAIKHIFSHINAQGCRVESFKKPTPEEEAHDFLWRIHKVTPKKGQTALFNRSHYEDVIVTRVHKLISAEQLKDRYARINGFEKILIDSDTIVIKFFLNISREEQEQRLLEREQDPTKAWKLSPEDWRERAFWDEYQHAYEQLLERCSKGKCTLVCDSRQSQMVSRRRHARPYRKNAPTLSQVMGKVFSPRGPREAGGAKSVARSLKFAFQKDSGHQVSKNSIFKV